MNAVRKALKGHEAEMQRVLQHAYQAIARYQRKRTARHERELRSAIGVATEFCARFKPIIPAYKRRYFDVLQRADALGLSARDLIMIFDRAVFELHTRMERSRDERDALGPWSKRVLEILDGRRALPADASQQPCDHHGETFITSGRTVVGGSIAGPVRVIPRDGDWSSVQTGEIVACKMTSPDLVMAVDRVAGMITEQGGLVCHAAILAREFNIPCVVGCGPFVSRLAAGQRVVLDASSGLLLAKPL